MLPLTPEMVAAVYVCLRQFPPFSRRKLPPADEVEFRVSNKRNTMGEYTRYVRTSDHIVTVSALTIGHFSTLANVVSLAAGWA